MECSEVLASSNDFLDGSLSKQEVSEIELHLVNCRTCREEYHRNELLLKALRSLPAPTPPAGYARQALKKAISRGGRQPRKWLGLWVGSALAACLTLWVAITLQTLQSDPFSSADWQGLVVNLNRPRTIKVLVTAPEDLDEAHVTIRLSKELEIVGFPGSREISWYTDIRKGKNNLELPVLARETGSAELVAEISHQKKNKELRVRMLVQDNRENSAERQKPSAVT